MKKLIKFLIKLIVIICAIVGAICILAWFMDDEEDGSGETYDNSWVEDYPPNVDWDSMSDEDS